MVTFISDLDNTLIYSRKPGNSCVEWYGDREITYMTTKAYDTFTSLLLEDGFIFIPCTARSFKQASRVSFIGSNIPKYMVCDMGASIYIDGVRSVEWYNYLKKLGVLDESRVENFKNIVENRLDLFKCRKIISNDNYFLVYAFGNREDAEKFYIDLCEEYVDNFFRYRLQGRKVYVCPVGLNKVLAVEWLKESLDLGTVITSGDSMFDEFFVAEGDIAYLPSHSDFIVEDAIVMENDSIFSGEDIVMSVSNIVRGY